MTFYAGAVVTRRAEPSGDLSPALRVRIDLQPRSRAVALQADISVTVACLTRGEVLSGLPGMCGGPLVLRQYAVGVARLALG